MNGLPMVHEMASSGPDGMEYQIEDVEQQEWNEVEQASLVDASDQTLVQRILVDVQHDVEHHESKEEGVCHLAQLLH